MDWKRNLMPLFEANPVGLKNFVRVKNTKDFKDILYYLYAQQDTVLYNHSLIYPFSFLNKGAYELFINKDNTRSKIIPVVKQFDLAMQYMLHTPLATTQEIVALVEHLDKYSKDKVIITDVTEKYAHDFLSMTSGWEKVKTSTDIIQNAELLSQLKGRDFSSLRNTLKHVRNDINPITEVLSPQTKQDAISVFEEWKEKQGAKYFRVTIGRDIRLIEEYADKIDFVNTFSYIHYSQERVPIACSFGCRSSKDSRWGQDITVKANIDYRGMGDFAFIHLIQEMNKCGIVHVNDSGGDAKVKLNKLKFRPTGTVPMYDLRRKV